MDKHPLKYMGQVFVHGRIPSQNHGARIRTVDEYPVEIMAQIFVRGRIAPILQMDFPSIIRQIFSHLCGVCKVEFQPFNG